MSRVEASLLLTRVPVPRRSLPRSGGRLYQHVVRIDGDPTRANHITTSIVASTSREQLEGVLSDVSQLPGIVATVKEQLHI